jgi:hypothetical protein
MRHPILGNDPQVALAAAAVIVLVTLIAMAWLFAVKLEALYSEFTAEATRLFGDALTRQNDNITDMIGLYAMLGRMRLTSARTVIDAATQVAHKIIETYLGPNHSLHEIREYASKGELDLLGEFGEVCRKELAARERRLCGERGAGTLSLRPRHSPGPVNYPLAVWPARCRTPRPRQAAGPVPCAPRPSLQASTTRLITRKNFKGWYRKLYMRLGGRVIADGTLRLWAPGVPHRPRS